MQLKVKFMKQIATNVEQGIEQNICNIIYSSMSMESGEDGYHNKVNIIVNSHSCQDSQVCTKLHDFHSQIYKKVLISTGDTAPLI